MNKRQLLAACSAALILLLYILSILFAVIGSPFARQLLMASLFCSVIIPVTLYGFLIYSRNTARKKTETDSGNADEAEEKPEMPEARQNEKPEDNA